MSYLKNLRILLVSFVGILIIFLVLHLYKIYLIRKDGEKLVKDKLIQYSIAGEDHIGAINCFEHPRGFFFSTELLPGDIVFADYIKKRDLSLEDMIIPKDDKKIECTIFTEDGFIENADEVEISSHSNVEGVLVSIASEKELHPEIPLSIMEGNRHVNFHVCNMLLSLNPNNFHFHFCSDCNPKILRGAGEYPDLRLYMVACDKGNFYFIAGFMSRNFLYGWK